MVGISVTLCMRASRSGCRLVRVEDRLVRPTLVVARRDARGPHPAASIEHSSPNQADPPTIHNHTPPAFCFYLPRRRRKHARFAIIPIEFQQKCVFNKDLRWFRHSPGHSERDTGPREAVSVQRSTQNTPWRETIKDTYSKVRKFNKNFKEIKKGWCVDEYRTQNKPKKIQTPCMWCV